jgi:hypothetical protein
MVDSPWKQMISASMASNIPPIDLFVSSVHLYVQYDSARRSIFRLLVTHG